MKTRDDFVTATALEVPGCAPATLALCPADSVSGHAPGRARSIRVIAKHPRLMPYHRLMLTVMVVNLAVLLHHQRRGDWQIADGTALSALSP